MEPAPSKLNVHNDSRAVRLVRALCGISGSLTFLDDIRAGMAKAGIIDAVAKHDTPKIFDWLLTGFAFQGISDQVAAGYIRKHGNVTWLDLVQAFDIGPACSLLKTYWHFEGCRYSKRNFTCSKPSLIDTCPLPSHRLRNGGLNRNAYSFFLFIRDLAKGDIVGWIDERLSLAPSAAVSTAEDRASERQERLLGPLRGIYGVSDKVLCMTFSELLLGSSISHPHWFDTGKDMIAVDSLVHGLLHRTGVLDECGVSHRYGPACLGPHGCAGVIRGIASHIDARAFNSKFPRIFPRFVQYSIWRFCAADGLDICNGNRLDDRKSCENTSCQLFDNCSRKPLKYRSF